MQLLESIEGIEVIPFGEAEQCCGFGGTFSVSFPHVSSSMGCLKLEHITAVQPDFVVSGDMSCLMHLGGLAERDGKPIKTLHFVQILQAALQNHA
jgi:L-lactate dehydrogenase complex protein LldE